MHEKISRYSVMLDKDQIIISLDLKSYAFFESMLENPPKQNIEKMKKLFQSQSLIDRKTDNE